MQNDPTINTAGTVGGRTALAARTTIHTAREKGRVGLVMRVLAELMGELQPTG